MNHNPLYSFNDGLEITYSDLKKTESGVEYTTIYFEQPNKAKTGFCSAEYDYPGDGFYNVQGYSKKDMGALEKHAKRVREMALRFSREDAYA